MNETIKVCVCFSCVWVCVWVCAWVCAWVRFWSYRIKIQREELKLSECTSRTEKMKGVTLIYFILMERQVEQLVVP